VDNRGDGSEDRKNTIGSMEQAVGRRMKIEKHSRE